jgi:hypothetical protein
MKTAQLSIAASVLLLACSETPEVLADTTDTSDATDASDAIAQGTDGITSRPALSVADQLIECVEDQGGGVSEAELFVISDGAVKRYSRSMNRAQDMCPQGMPDCALGWRDDRIALYFRLPSGESRASSIDLETLTIDKHKIDDAGARSRASGICTSSPLPDGITID